MEYEIEFILEPGDEYDDCECILSEDDLRSMGIDIRYNQIEEDWLLWN